MGQASFSDIFIGVSQRYPDRIAIESPGSRLTYSEFIARASRNARELAGRGIQAKARVGISSRRNEDVMVLMCALWMIGAVAVPMDFRTRPPEREALAREFELEAILEDRPPPPGSEPAYRSIVTDHEWLAHVARQAGDPMFSPATEAPALIALTSGSSGKRIGALLDHEQLLLRTHLPAGLGQRDAGGRLLNLSPLSFTASIHATLTQLSNAGTVIFFPVVFSAGEVAQAIGDLQVTSITTVPTVVRSLLEFCGDRDAPAFDQLKFFYCAGAPLSADEKQRALRVLCGTFLEIYASTFTGRICFLDSPDIPLHAGSVGSVLPQVSLQIVDSQGECLPAGKAGLIRVRAPGMTLAVCGSAAQRTQGDRIVDGWVYTGDAGQLDSDGFLYLLGRDSEMIIRGGENVYPAEVEAVALRMPGVQEAVAVGYPSQLHGEDIAVFVVAQAGITEQAMLAHFRGHLVPNKTPRVIRFLDSLPRNENGKVRYADLKSEFAVQ